MSSFNATKYKNEFTKEKYDRLNIQVPKGQKAVIEEYWKAKGYKSLNAYVNDLIQRDMNNTPGIQVNHNKGIVAGNIHGDINMKYGHKRTRMDEK